jgi:hypothetical protein
LRSHRSLRRISEDHGRGEAARSEILTIENADPLASLTADGLERANRRRAFALDSCEVLGIEELEKKLRSVLTGGDKGEIAAYLMGVSAAERGLSSARRTPRETRIMQACRWMQTAGGSMPERHRQTQRA